MIQIDLKKWLEKPFLKVYDSDFKRFGREGNTIDGY